MFKNWLPLLTLIFICNHISAQPYFDVEQRTIKANLLTTRYTFGVIDADSITLIDSTQIYHSRKELIVRTDKYDIANKMHASTLAYYNKLGNDSIDKYFENEILKKVTIVKYDSLNRIVFESTKPMNNPPLLKKKVEKIYSKNDAVQHYGYHFEKVEQEEYDYFIKHHLTRTESVKDSSNYLTITTITNEANKGHQYTYEYIDTVKNGQKIVLQTILSEGLFLYAKPYIKQGIDYDEHIELDKNTIQSSEYNQGEQICFESKIAKLPKINGIESLNLLARQVIKNNNLLARSERCLNEMIPFLFKLDSKDKNIQFKYKQDMASYIDGAYVARFFIMVKKFPK